MLITAVPAAGQQAANKQKQQDQPQPAAEKPLPQLSPDARYDYQWELAWLAQLLAPMRSPYAGSSSLRGGEAELAHVYTLYLGARLRTNVEAYINPELALGHGLSGGGGAGGYPNGMLNGQDALRQLPYLARYFVRWRVPMPHLGPHSGGENQAEEQVGRALNIIAGKAPAHRLVLTAGKFAVSDVFDVNGYANNPRSAFLNKAFVNNLAFDFAQDTRGYDLGISAAWVNPGWAVRFGTFAMPTTGGGPDLSYNWSHDHAEQIEAEIHPQLLRGKKPPMVLRLLYFRNVGNMGRYADALLAAPGAPDISAVRHSGTVRQGIGLNFEQALADGGNTGIFGRAGLATGSVESYAFAECDRTLPFGGQLSGAHWRRRDDRVGLALAANGISATHRAYLAAGGMGLALGDGALSYGGERVAELYYAHQVSKSLTATLDLQQIANPGYNRARGPAYLAAVRIRAQY